MFPAWLNWETFVSSTLFPSLARPSVSISAGFIDMYGGFNFWILAVRRSSWISSNFPVHFSEKIFLHIFVPMGVIVY